MPATAGAEGTLKAFTAHAHSFQFRSGPLPVIHVPGKPAGQNIIEFAERRLGFFPDEQQRLILTSDTQRGILNCTRQWGKNRDLGR